MNSFKKFAIAKPITTDAGSRSPHLFLAHDLWRHILKPDDCAIDATCGGGNDTLYLASLLPQGRLIALDIQPAALKKTQDLLEKHLSPEQLRRIELRLHSHADLSKLQYTKPPKLIVYNLGYLPGGDKSLTTRTETTLQSLAQAIDLVSPMGAISLTCYPGHPEGAREQAALLDFASSSVPLSLWEIHHHFSPTRPHSPSLLLLKKNM